MCERLAALIAEHREEFRDLIVDELGHTKFLADVYHSVAPTLHWNYYAKLGRNFKFAEVREADLSALAGNAGGLIMKYETKSLVVREPVGVVAVLCAFNFPLPGIAQKTAPALVAGCTAVVKAPDPDPLAIFAMADLVSRGGLPARRAEHRRHRCAGVRAPGRPSGRRHGHLHRLHGGRQEDRRDVCAEQVKPVVLELGGKSAAIILEDADLDAVLPMVAGISAGTSQGESCVCMSRILAPRSRYDEIAAGLTEAFAAMKVGDPYEEDTIVGPLISEAHRERVLGFVEKAVDEGATVATGGKAPEHLDKGWYVEPTLLTNVEQRHDGRPGGGLRAGHRAHPLRGRGGRDPDRQRQPLRPGRRVFTSDPARGFEIARRVRSGTFSVNTFVGGLQLAVRRLQGVRDRSRARPDGDRGVPPLQDDLGRPVAKSCPRAIVRSVERTPAPV